MHRRDVSNISSLGVNIPNGFVVTTKSYDRFINSMDSRKDSNTLSKMNEKNSIIVGDEIRNMIRLGNFLMTFMMK